MFVLWGSVVVLVLGIVIVGLFLGIEVVGLIGDINFGWYFIVKFGGVGIFGEISFVGVGYGIL